MTGLPTVPDRDLNPGPLSFEASAFLTELTRPDNFDLSDYFDHCHNFDISNNFDINGNFDPSDNFDLHDDLNPIDNFDPSDYF